MTYQKSTDPVLLNLHNIIEYDSKGNPAIRLSDLSSSPFDLANLSAFQRLRTTEAKLLGEYRYMYSSGTSFEMNDYTVNGGTIQVDYTIPAAKIICSTNASSRSVRQTKQYHPYIAGTNNLAFMSFIFGAPNNSVQQLGLFDDLNGIFLRFNSSGVASFVIRNNSVDSEEVTHPNWNLNIPQLDYTKAQILVIDYQWLGVGTVRIGFVIDGKIVYCHQFHHTNALASAPYMHQPSLPCRWEVYASGGTPTVSSTLTAICAAVYCEGSVNESGFTRSISSGVNQIMVSNSTDGQCLLAIRLKNSLITKPNRSVARLLSFSVLSTNMMRFQLIRLENDAKISSPVWSSVPGYSWCEYLTNASMVAGWATDNAYNVIDDGFVSGSIGQASAIINHDNQNKTSCIFQNYDSSGSQVFLLVGYKMAVIATASASLQWIECK